MKQAYFFLKHVFRGCVILAFVLLCAVPESKAQGNRSAWLDYTEVSTGGVLATGDEAPFWMWANSYGRNSYDNASGYVRLRFGKEVQEHDGGLDWFYGFDATGRLDSGTDIVWTDAYVGLTYSKFELYAGKRAEFFGLADTLLTAGPELYSRNAPPLTKIVLRTHDYFPVFDWFAVNGYLAHGWMGDDRFVKDAYLHQKYLFVRLGSDEPDRGVNFFGGIHHLAIWGGEGKPSSFDDFWRIFFGKGGGEDAPPGEQSNALGDHFGSFEYALKVKSEAWDYMLYYQTLFTDSSGMKWYGIWPQNAEDIMFGFSLIRKERGKGFQRFNIEYLNTRDHGGKPNEQDNYFDHRSIYRSGWINDGYALGHPFIRFDEGNDFDNAPHNKVRGINVGATLQFSKFVNPLVRIAYIEDYGNAYDTDAERRKLYAFDITNTSFLSDGWSLVEQIALDTGDNISTSLGVGLTIRKSLGY